VYIYFFIQKQLRIIKTKIFTLLVFLTVILAVVTCKKKDSGNPGPNGTDTWDLVVKEPSGDTFVIAKGTFTFNPTGFTVHIVTSLIGGPCVKEFDMSGKMEGDSIIMEDFVLNLTDPDEVVTVNGRVGVQSATMNGYGTYWGYQPPDTMTFSGAFVVTGVKE
jgi:hypothetical protein